MSHPEAHSTLTPDAPVGFGCAGSVQRMDAFVHSAMPKVGVGLGLGILGIVAVVERKYAPWTIAKTKQMIVRCFV